MKRRISRFLIVALLLAAVQCCMFSAGAVGNKIDNSKKYVGMYATNFKDVSAYGTDVNMLGWFDNLYSGPSEGKLSMCLDQHRYTAFITLQPKVSSNDDKKPNKKVMKQIADGKYDTMIINYLQALSRNGRDQTELFVRFAHEFEPSKGSKGDVIWYQWQNSDYKSYVKAFRRVVTLGRQYAPNVKWVWSPNRCLKSTKNYYPGDAYVDYVGITLNTNQTGTITYPTFESYYTRVSGGKSGLEAYGKPIIFGEVAVNITNLAAKERYLSSLVEYLGNYSRCVGFVILNENVISGTGNYRPFRFSNKVVLKKAFAERARALINDFILPVADISNGNYAGSQCRSIYIPNGVSSIGSKAFDNCPNLEAVRIPNSVKIIADDAFGNTAGIEIYGTPGSAAEMFANSKGFRFLVEKP